MQIAVNSRLIVPHKTDGIARFTLETFKRISKAHPEHEFTFIFDRDVPGLDFGPNNKIVKLNPPARHPILWYIWFEMSLKRFLNKGKFDLFVSPEGWVPGGLKMPSLAVIHDLNFIHLPENVAFSHRLYLQHFFPKYARRASRIATVSNYSKEDIVQCFNLDNNKVDVVYNGVNLEFRELKDTEKAKIKDQFSFSEEFFVFVGTLHPRKNLDNLFLAFNSFKKKSNSKVKLLVVGNKKWWPNSLQESYESLEHKADILFTGRLEDQELAKVMSSALALTYVPHFEGFGIPILEAFASKTPVITANNTSLPEVAADAALLCDSKNVVDIANAMEQIASDQALREELVSKGSERLKDFSWEKSAELLWDSISKTIQ